MEEQFLLKRYGKLSLFEQENIAAEDRRWWLKRLKEEQEKEKESSDKQRSI